LSSIVRQKVGKHVYLYESVSYRNAEGKPRNKRVPIGKIDAKTGQPIYNGVYLARMAEQGTPIPLPVVPPTFTVADIQHSCVKEFGAMYLLERMAEQIELTQALTEAFPLRHPEIFMLACYLVASGDPFLYCEDWLSRTEVAAVGSLSSQRISELLAAITFEERERFYQLWCKRRSEREYLALDITSASSYSSLIEEVEWGYNRDQEQLPQINICMLVGEASRLPIYQVIYSGSLKDVSTLHTTLDKLAAISQGKPTLAVMDKGFYSAKNVNAMLKGKGAVRFVISVPFTASFAKKLVHSERKDIDQLQHTIVVGGESIRAVTKRRSWSSTAEVYAHVYYNAMKAARLREELYAHVTALKEQAQANPAKAQQDEACVKYLIIRKSETSEFGYTINVREDVVAQALETAGWLVIISNDVADAKEALTIYRHKDVVEKGFLQLKNRLDLDRLRVHQEDRMHNKVFVGFLALILMSQLHRVMLDKQLYKRMTMKKMLLSLAKLRVQHINGERILFPLTKEQKEIYTAFRVKEPL